MIAPILIAIFFTLTSLSYMGRANEYLQNNQIMLGILMICFSVTYLIGIVGYFYKHRYSLLFSLVLIVGQTVCYIGVLIWIIITDLPDLGYSFILFLLMWVTGLFIHASIILYTWGLYDKVKNEATGYRERINY